MKREKEREREKKTFMLEVLALVAMCCNVLQHGAMCCNVKSRNTSFVKRQHLLQYVAVSCNVV